MAQDSTGGHSTRSTCGERGLNAERRVEHCCCHHALLHFTFAGPRVEPMPAPTYSGILGVARADGVRTARSSGRAARLEEPHQPRARALRARRRPLHAAASAAGRDTALMVEALRPLGASIERTATATCGSTPAPDRRLAADDRLRPGRHAHAVPAAGRAARRRARALRRRRAGARPADGDHHRCPSATLGVDVDDDGRGTLPFTVPAAGACAAASVTIDASGVEPVRLGPAARRRAAPTADRTSSTAAAGCRRSRTST